MEIIRVEAKKCTDEFSPINKFNKMREETESLCLEEKRKQGNKVCCIRL